MFVVPLVKYCQLFINICSVNFVDKVIEIIVELVVLIFDKISGAPLLIENFENNANFHYFH